jgi:hypothetical protein
MNRLITGALAVMILLLGLLVPTTAVAGDTSWGRAAAPTQTQAKDTSWGKVKQVKRLRAYGTDVTHSRNDSGYTAAIHIQCTNGTHRWLPKGYSTFSVGYSCGIGGVQYIIPGADQAVRCFNQLPPYGSHYFMTGYREVPSWASLDCYMQRPI